MLIHQLRCIQVYKYVRKNIKQKIYNSRNDGKNRPRKLLLFTHTVTAAKADNDI